MILRALAVPVLWLSAATLPAQFFTSTETEARRTARATWLGLSGEQSVVVDYGQPEWRPEYERFMERRDATPALLGKGALTTLRSDVALAFGEQQVAKGRWYVGARRDDKGEWSLALFAADRIDADGRGATAVLATEPEVRVPVRVTRDAESVKQFEITVADDKGSTNRLTLRMAWGPWRIGAAFTASFDARLPDGAPRFALTADGKGTKTGSGLVYEAIHAGNGATPGPNDLLRLHYAGWLTDGTLFTSSYLRGAPEQMSMQMTMPGFAEGLGLMRTGATFRLTIPPDLAFGARGAGSRVPPDATVVYHVTLLSIGER